jgi:hypothetical protein
LSVYEVYARTAIGKEERGKDKVILKREARDPSPCFWNL